MRVLALLLLGVFSTLLAAQHDFNFDPHRVFPKPHDIEHTCLHVTWTDPGVKVKTIEVFLLEQLWPPTIDAKVPDWRKRVTADDFDAAAFAQEGGPRLQRLRLDVEEGRATKGFMDQRAKYAYVYVQVLWVDEAGGRHNVEGMKGAVQKAGTLDKTLYCLPTWQPELTLNRAWDRGPTMFEWTVPDLGGGSLEVTRLWFAGIDKVVANGRLEDLPRKMDGFLAGEDAHTVPLVQELAKDATSAWVASPPGFLYAWVVAETKGGLKFTCPMKVQDDNTCVRQPTQAEQKTVLKLDLKRAGENKAKKND